MLGYGAVAPQYKHELPRAMKELGFRTVVIGKDHFGWNVSLDRPMDHGFESLTIYDGTGSGMPGSMEYDDYDRWFQQKMPGEHPLKSGGLQWNSWRGAPYEYPEEMHPTAWTGNQTITMLEQLARAQDPFFLKVSFHRPHSPYDPPQRLFDAVAAPQQAPARAVDGWDEHNKHCVFGSREDAWCGSVSDDALTTTRRAYLASIKFVDEQIGLIINSLHRLDLYDSTFILFTSDHGDMQQDHYLWRKGYPYEGSVHVPLIMRWPQALSNDFVIRRGSRVSALTELRDIFPTFLDVVGHWNASWDLDGRPLTQWLRAQKPQDWREWVDMEEDVVYPFVQWNALTDGYMKFIFDPLEHSFQLFNLTEDPMENRDLAKVAAYAGELGTWKDRMVKQFQSEKRGSRYVANGKLQRRVQSCLYSPHYPYPVHRGCQWKSGFLFCCGTPGDQLPQHNKSADSDDALTTDHVALVV